MNSCLELHRLLALDRPCRWRSLLRHAPALEDGDHVGVDKDVCPQRHPRLVLVGLLRRDGCSDHVRHSSSVCSEFRLHSLREDLEFLAPGPVPKPAQHRNFFGHDPALLRYCYPISPAKDNMGLADVVEEKAGCLDHLLSRFTVSGPRTLYRAF